MNYFLDTEFLEAGPSQPVSLISIGIVSEDGREFYAESNHLDLDYAVSMNPWLKDNVVNQLVRTSKLLPRSSLVERFQYMRPGVAGGVFFFDEIAPKILEFIPPAEKPTFWGYFSAYDWVVFAQLFGSMINLPKGYPYYCKDLKQWMDSLAIPKSQLPKQVGKLHNALEDARWNRRVHKYLTNVNLEIAARYSDKL